MAKKTTKSNKKKNNPPKEFWKKVNWYKRPGENAFTGSAVTISDELTPSLRELASLFPKEFPRAMRDISDILKHEIVRAVERGSTPNGRLDPLSRMHMYYRMELLKMGMGTDDGWENGSRFRLKKKLDYKMVKGTDRLMERWRGDVRKGNIRESMPMSGKIKRTITTKVRGNLTIVVGAQNPVAMRWLEAAQAGRRGSKGVFQYLGRQPITPAMRRAFWAAGIPLSKDKQYIEQPERSVVTPVWREFSKRFPSLLVKRVEDIINGLTG